jgi:acetyl-CoA acetyltransferase
MDDVYVIGIGMTRFGKTPGRSVRSMAEEATQEALDDAGIGRKDLHAVFFSNTFWGMFANQHSIRGQVIMRGMGIDKIPIVNVENACAGASTALNMAYTGIRARSFDVALAVGSEKITNPDKALSLAAYGSCMDVENFEKHINMIVEVGKTFKLKIPEDNSAPGEGRSIFMDAYAMNARWHMNKYGSTQKQMAAVCAKNHFHGSLNPLAQYQASMTVDEVLNDRLVAYPLTRAMCAPVGDGAAAAVVCSGSYLRKLKAARPVKILASILGQGSDRDLDGEDIGERLSRQAYKAASLGPGDIDIAELHDATAWSELHQTEVMGFCPIGEGGSFAVSGATRIGGSKPVNTSGGLECRGHPIGASGLAQIHELVLQLRGAAGQRQVEKVRVALAENGGGNIGVEEAAMCIHILKGIR